MAEDTPMTRISANLAKVAKKTTAATSRATPAKPAPPEKPGAAPKAPPAAPERTSRTATTPKAAVAAKPPAPAAAPFEPAALLQALAPRFDAMTRELRELKRLVQPATPAGDAALEQSVDSLRRLLSEAIEQRMESVVTELVEVHRELSSADAARAGERLARLLETLGAVRFTAEPLDAVDPLIHVVVEERRDDRAPDGVVLETVRPGYRTARGALAGKAAVVVNRRS
jgi:hypothetical protein